MSRQRLPFDTRRLREGDIPYVRSSWIRSYAKYWVGKCWPRGVSPAVYNLEHPGVVMSLLVQNITVIACNPEDDDHIFGYACFGDGEERPIVHYLFVKGMYRGRGIGRGLLRIIQDDTEHKPLFASHWVPPLTRMVPPDLNIEFNPYTLPGGLNGKA